jgi:hypothetical protein
MVFPQINDNDSNSARINALARFDRQLVDAGSQRQFDGATCLTCGQGRLRCGKYSNNYDRSD